MSRKVLISFLGTGPLGRSGKSSVGSREYRSTDYRIDDKEYKEKLFVADALTTHYDIDTIFIIGTVKSMWEELYRAFCAKKGIEPDEEYYTELGSISETATCESKLEIPYKEKIEKVLGNDSKVILINYGLNEDELNNNISTILGLEKDLKNGDKLYVDITHSFRSLPLLIMNTLIHLQNVSNKNITIEHISYGMLDVVRELGYAPVVDLKKVLEVNDWITGAYSFSEFGNAYKISKLLESVDKDASKRLYDFTDELNINHMAALQNSARKLSGIKLDALPPIAKMTVSPVVKDFIRSIGSFDSTSEFQYKLAKWQRDKRNYYAAYLTLVEAIVSYVCEECCLNECEKADRETAKDNIFNHSRFKDIRNTYNKINEIRNHLAHSLATSKNNNKIKQILNDAIDKLKDYFIPKRN